MKKSVLITGASSGIGAATAKEFSKNGYSLILLGRNLNGLKKTAKSCKTKTHLIECDLDNQKSIELAIKEISKISNLNGIVNNAGIYKQANLSLDSIHIWKSQFQTNLFSHVQLTLGLLPLLKKSKSAFITNNSSTLGLRPTADTAAYSASKAAMISWTQSLALATAPFQIRVNVICPGIVETPIHGFDMMSQTQRKKAINNLKSLQPLSRIGNPEEIAKSIFFISSENSSWTTGSCLSVDGGINLV